MIVPICETRSFSSVVWCQFFFSHQHAVHAECDTVLPVPLTYARMVWPGETKFDVLARGGVASFSGVSHTPIPRGWGSSVPKIIGRPPMRAHSKRKNNQILHGDQTGCKENFCMVDYECWRAMFAIANLLVQCLHNFGFTHAISLF